MQSKEFLSLIGAPWAAYHDHSDPHTAASLAEIRSVGTPKLTAEEVCSVSLCNYDIDDTGRRQRARRDLIAAAPELYEALEAALMVLDGNGPREVFDRARAALAKARGETGEQS